MKRYLQSSLIALLFAAISINSIAHAAENKPDAGLAPCVTELLGHKLEAVIELKVPEQVRSGDAFFIEVLTELPQGMSLVTALSQNLKLNEALEGSDFRTLSINSELDLLDSQKSKGKKSQSKGAELHSKQFALLALANEPGEHSVQLPELPLQILAGDDVLTICSRPTSLRILDPLVEEAKAAQDTKKDEPPSDEPQKDPEELTPPQFLESPDGLVQIEPWRLMENILAILLAGMLGAAIAYFLWSKRPKPVKAAPPPPPPRPAWEIALEQLNEIKTRSLDDAEQLLNAADALNHTLREYLGNRYDFEALESTTAEIIQDIRFQLNPAQLEAVQQQLESSDLWKFANSQPNAEQLHQDLRSVEALVHATKSLPLTATDSTSAADSLSAAPPDLTKRQTGDVDIAPVNHSKEEES